MDWYSFYSFFFNERLRSSLSIFDACKSKKSESQNAKKHPPCNDLQRNNFDSADQMLNPERRDWQEYNNGPAFWLCIIIFERCIWRRKNFHGSDPRINIELILLQEKLNDKKALDISIYYVCVYVCMC